MNSAIKFIFILTLAMASNHAWSAQGSYKIQGCTSTDLSDAESYYTLQTGEVQQGRISQIEMLAAEAVRLDVQLCSGSISVQDYCTLRTANLEKIRELYILRGALTAQYFADLLEVRSRCSTH